MKLLPLVSHGFAVGVGFALGVYFLPILTAGPKPTDVEVQVAQVGALFEAQFVRELPGSDFLHWGEGKVTITPSRVVFQGDLAPGPDYRLYLSPSFANDESSFLQVKASAVEVGAVKSFDGFIVTLPDGVDVNRFNSVVVWCETFGEFITAAKYQ